MNNALIPGRRVTAFTWATTRQRVRPDVRARSDRGHRANDPPEPRLNVWLQHCHEPAPGVRESCARMAFAMPSSPVHHPVFARLWVLMSRHEPGEIRRHRDELLAGLSGRVIEVGPGAGSNSLTTPRRSRRWWRWSPSPICWDKPASRLPARTSRSRSSTASPTSCLRMTRRSMPLSRLWFSAQCPIRRALAELHRVLRPGGELRFYEHVRSDRPALAFTQRAVDRMSGRARSGGVIPLATPPARSPPRASRSSSCGGCGSTRCRSLGRMRSAARADAEAAASTGWKARRLSGGFHG